MHTMAKFLMEMCLTDYSMLEYLPSQIAASALYISNKLYSDGQWVNQKLLCCVSLFGCFFADSYS